MPKSLATRSTKPAVLWHLLQPEPRRAHTQLEHQHHGPVEGPLDQLLAACQRPEGFRRVHLRRHQQVAAGMHAQIEIVLAGRQLERQHELAQRERPRRPGLAVAGAPLTIAPLAIRREKLHMIEQREIDVQQARVVGVDRIVHAAAGGFDLGIHRVAAAGLLGATVVFVVSAMVS